VTGQALNRTIPMMKSGHRTQCRKSCLFQKGLELPLFFHHRTKNSFYRLLKVNKIAEAATVSSFFCSIGQTQFHFFKFIYQLAIYFVFEAVINRFKLISSVVKKHDFSFRSLLDNPAKQQIKQVGFFQIPFSRK